MPLYEYECLRCRSNLEASLKSLEEKTTKKGVSDLVRKYPNIHYLLVIDLDNKKLLAEYGKKKSNATDMDFYLDDGSKMVLVNIDKFRFSELIFDKEDEKKLKCYCGETKKIERVVSSFAYTHDLSTSMPKPDLSGLPPEVRAKTFISDYIEEKDRPKANR
jgi:hypothetical protein